MVKLKQVALSEYQSIVLMLENLLADGYCVEFRTQPAPVDGFSEYVVIITNEDGDTISGAELPDLADALEEAHAMTQEVSE